MLEEGYDHRFRFFGLRDDAVLPFPTTTTTARWWAGAGRKVNQTPSKVFYDYLRGSRVTRHHVRVQWGVYALLVHFTVRKLTFSSAKVK